MLLPYQQRDRHDRPVLACQEMLLACRLVRLLDPPVHQSRQAFRRQVVVRRQDAAVHPAEVLGLPGAVPVLVPLGVLAFPCPGLTRRDCFPA